MYIIIIMATVLTGILLNVGTYKYSKRGLEEKLVKTNGDMIILIMCFLLPFLCFITGVLVKLIDLFTEWKSKDI